MRATCLHPGLPPHGLKRNAPVPDQAHVLNAPTLNLSHFRLVFRAPEASGIRGKHARSAASTGGRSDHSGTLQGAISGTRTHSRRTGSKLGRLHCARQGLVRVSESNTKYGGKSGKTGGLPRRCCWQVSVSPQGFPRKKIPFRHRVPRCARCSQGNYLLWRRACLGKTQVKLRQGMV